MKNSKAIIIYPIISKEFQGKDDTTILQLVARD